MDIKKIKIVLITSGQPSTNPRLVKEADALSEAGYLVTVIYQYWNEWATQKDQELLKTKKWNYKRVGGAPNQSKYEYWSTRISNKLYKVLTQKFSLKFGLAERSMCRTMSSMLKVSIKLKADLYIAHNLGALSTAVIAAKENKVKCGFDAEDFHRNEVSNDQNNFDVKIKKFIEDKYIYQLDYLTAASPLITKAYGDLYPTKNPILINNVFELSYQPELKLNYSRSLKLFWFSQTIGKNRGLQCVIEAINRINNPLIELHLLGELLINERKYFDSLANFEIQYYKPIASKNIFNLASEFDIGLALEPAFCFNNEIALTNKLFTYLTSGLAIIASNTPAQQQFIKENISIGELYKIGDVNGLSKIINKLFNDKVLLNEYKRSSYRLAQSKYNWEVEKEKFLSIVYQTIHN